MANGIKRFKELSENYMDNPRILRNMLKNMQELCEELKSENIKLKDQLTWHPASEKPEEGQFVFGYNQKTKYFDVIFFYNGSFYLRGIAVTITHWLPIPPAPEGE